MHGLMRSILRDVRKVYGLKYIVTLQSADFCGVTGASTRGCEVWSLENTACVSTGMRRITTVSFMRRKSGLAEK